MTQLLLCLQLLRFEGEGEGLLLATNKQTFAVFITYIRQGIEGLKAPCKMTSVTATNGSRIFDGAEAENYSCFRLEVTADWVIALHTILLCTIVLASVLGNGLVLLLVAKYKQLRCRSVVVGLSVVAADVLITVNFIIPALASTIVQRWPFTAEGCTAFGFLGLEFLITKWLAMGVLSIDRFCTVRFPFSYEKYSKGVLIVLSLAGWLAPVVFGIPSLAGFGGNLFRENIPTCLFDCATFGNACKIYYALYYSTAFILGCVLPTILYIWLYWRARKLHPSTLALGKLSIQIASGTIISQPIAHLERNSHESQALVTFVIVCVTALITGLPLYVMELVRTTSFQAFCRIPLIVHFLVVDLYSLSTALDPVLIMRHSDFCLCLRDLFCCAKSILPPIPNHPQPQANSSSRSDPPEQSTTANISPV